MEPQSHELRGGSDPRTGRCLGRHQWKWSNFDVTQLCGRCSDFGAVFRKGVPDLSLYESGYEQSLWHANVEPQSHELRGGLTLGQAAAWADTSGSGQISTSHNFAAVAAILVPFSGKVSQTFPCMNLVTSSPCDMRTWSPRGVK